jgi:hypothetical protein
VSVADLVGCAAAVHSQVCTCGYEWAVGVDSAFWLAYLQQQHRTNPTLLLISLAAAVVATVRWQGGTYEGEWASGVMSGTGLRTYSSGKVVAGRWEGGQLAAPLELWQCAAAAEGAAEAALAARR